jgi:nitrogen fixation/metabolism regulation signal transduction histidine kinase
VITEAARNDDGALRAVRLKVSDNGGGFGEKVLKRAFEPYVTTKPRGTGLGLAVVKKIADEHGARVRIVNRRAPSASADSEAEGEVIGAQVSLSFSRFSPASAANAPDLPALASTPNPAPAMAPGAAPGQ